MRLFLPELQIANPTMSMFMLGLPNRGMRMVLALTTVLKLLRNRWMTLRSHWVPYSAVGHCIVARALTPRAAVLVSLHCGDALVYCGYMFFFTVRSWTGSLWACLLWLWFEFLRLCAHSMVMNTLYELLSNFVDCDSLMSLWLWFI